MSIYRRSDRPVRFAPIGTALREIRQQSFASEMEERAAILRKRVGPALTCFDDAEAVKERRAKLIALTLTFASERASHAKGSPVDRAYQAVTSEMLAESTTLRDLLRKRHTLAAAFQRQAQTEWDPDNPLSLISALRELVYDMKRGTGYHFDEDDQQLINDAQQYVQRNIQHVAGAK